MYTDKLLQYAIPAQKKFQKMYENHDYGLVAICDSYVQVTEEKFKELVDSLGLGFICKSRKNLYHLETEIDGVVFVTCTTRKELQKVGLM